ncbi:Hemicentin-1 [Mizuhopecten yessoensis]|uniref:Hemicentin-1 n=1 Tax=Mizuhopecten yessoensis TaxID=6573 RepID=A0A210Q7F3_MIZYE|nr:Hemicentin-1 [Mizuhopecten yessoensis]
MQNIAQSMNVELFVTTMRTTTVNVQVTAPRYSSAGINEAFTVTAGTVKQLFFNPSIRLYGNEMSSKAVFVTADDEVVIYGVNKETYSCDAFLGLPTDVLGTEYYAVTYYPPSRQCELLIVGVNDSTTVNIKVGDAIGSRYITWGGTNYYQGNTLTVTMNRFDTFQLVTYGDLSGTYITSSKAVSVFSGNMKTNIGSGGSSDHLVEHLTNVDTWGKRFVTVPVPRRTVGDYFKFIASESSTQVTISGGYSTSFSLSNAGTVVQKTISSNAHCLVVSDKPILVVQFCLSQQSSNEASDPMMMIIPPVEQYGADYTFTTPKYSLGSYSNYFMFIIKESDKSGLRLDGNAFPSNTVYNTISGTDYVGGYISVSEGSHTVRHTSPISIFGGYLYGQANYETYGFTTGMRMAGINTICVPSTTVVGDGIDNDCDGLIDEELCNAENLGNDDDGDGTAEEDCATPPPINGGWSSYGAYGACSITCQSTTGGATSGTKTKTRYCNNPTPKYDGQQCSGSDTLTASCTPSTYCPVHGGWGSWGSYGSCSVTCASGTKTRTRSCNNPTPLYNGNNCSGSSTDTASCTLSPCPIDGAWTSWAAWSTCTVTCGGGTSTRDRTCTDPSPQHGGASCPGNDTATMDCNTQVCIIDGEWAAWNAWGTCTLTCGNGTQSRSRSCSDPLPLNGGLQCPGSSGDFLECNTQACPAPIAGVYQQLCPVNWFTCESGQITCIEKILMCDCDSDCDDGSDETEGYAGCNSYLLQSCGNGANGVLTLVCLACQFSGTLGAPDNRGTEFIIGYMQNIAESLNVELFVTTMRTTTVNVRITAPRYSDAGINEAFTVTAGTVKQLFFHPRIRLYGNEMSSKAVLVTADDEVVIYGVNKETYSCDAFLGLPTDVMGTEYYAMTYYPPSRQCELLIVGVNDSTTVNIKVGDAIGSRYISWGGSNYYRGNTLTVTMDRFDTFQLVTYGDLSGTYITSSKPISVFSGNRKTNIGSGGSSDHLVEHLTNVDTWGKRFVTVPVPKRTVGDYFKFIASESNTRVTISGGYSNSFTLSSAGTVVQKSISSNAHCLVVSDKPILVVQFCLSQQSSNEESDPMMMIIPPVEQFGADYTFATPKYSLGSYSNYFMFIIKESDKSGLRVDGNAFPSNTVYNRISGTDYVGGYISVSEGSHTVRHTSPISIFGGYLYGQARYETYGFTTGMRMAGINTVCVPTATVVGDGVDNDCDGLIDEELCTTENQGRDDDGDGTAEEDCATPPPIDGGWSSYGAYGACSVPCQSTTGGSTSGTKTQTRYCNNPTPKYDGKQCSGSATSTASCTPTIYCPVHGGWGSWGSYGSCSVTCASGTKTKTRPCNNPTPAHNGDYCSGSGSQTTSCTLSSCPIDGGWGAYGSWGSCSKSCGTGSRSKTRQCNNPAPANNGADCSGSTTSTDSCNTHACPIDGGWSSWGSYGSCSVTCAGGVKYRERTCTNPSPQYGGASCGNDDTSSATCNTHHCPIDGVWGSWGSFTSCSLTCKDYGTSQTGTKSRTRSCDSPTPQYNGAYCPNSDTDVDTCTTSTYCPIHGGWSAWSSWNTCSVTCASGIQHRTRTCTNPPAQYGGLTCGGSANDSQVCTLSPCPIDGAWTSWAAWSTCTVTCGGGTSTRDRTCTDPSPQYGGASCAGNDTAIMDCNMQVCIIDGAWAAWNQWGTCTVTCGNGTRSRSRSCSDPLPLNGGLQCPGSSGDFSECNTQACPVPVAGVYQQLCPVNWFTCESGQITCIDKAYMCDCDSDCDDGSDETEGYAGCNSYLLQSCGNGANSVLQLSKWLIALVLSSILLLRK